MDVETKSDGYWLWFLSKEKTPYIITGKYLFFSENFDALREIALEEIRNNGFHRAKINLRLIGNSTEHVLCLYYKDGSRKHELARKYKDRIKYRYWKSDKDTLEGKYSEEFLNKLIPRQRKEFQRVKGEIVFTDGKGRLIMRQRREAPSLIRIEMKKMELKPLVLSYELAWRTKDDENFMKSDTWRRVIRPRILKRDNYTCRYCGYQSEKGMHVNHIDGNPKNNSDDNLEVVCDMCHMITHSGLFCAILGIVEVYAESKYTQNKIVQITRKMRQEGQSDDEIRRFLGLKKRVPWKQDLKYLSRLYGFLSSRKPTRRSPKPLLTENEQREALRDRKNW